MTQKMDNLLVNRSVVNTWALSPNAVVVINDKGVRKYGLIQ